MSTSTVKSKKTETLSQARTWDIRTREAEDRGLCRKCAAQWAWGLQIGFSLSTPPCDKCVPVVARWRGPDKPNDWKGRRQSAGTRKKETTA